MCDINDLIEAVVNDSNFIQCSTMRVWELQDQLKMILEQDVTGESRGIHADNSIVVSPNSYGMMVSSDMLFYAFQKYNQMVKQCDHHL